MNCVGHIEKSLIKNSLCHPELAAPLVSDEKEAYKGGCSQSNSGSSPQQKCSAICTQKSNVGLKAQPTLISVSPRRRSIVMQGFRPNSPRKFAFTLAEVLITLGIIGVVAAMTMPSLMANYQKKETVVRLQKIYSQISQVIKLAEAEHGSIEGWNYANMGSSSREIVENFLNDYIIKHIKVLKKCDASNMSECINDPVMDLKGSIAYATTEASALYGVLTQDGYGILFWPGGITSDDGTESSYSQHMHFIVDINGPRKGENRTGKDIFVISANFGPQVSLSDTSVENRPKRSGVHFYGNGWLPELTRDEILTSSHGCNNTVYRAGVMCGALIQRDGWEIKDDYPW